MKKNTLQPNYKIRRKKFTTPDAPSVRFAKKTVSVVNRWMQA